MPTSVVQEGRLLHLLYALVRSDLVLQGLCVCLLVGMGKWLEVRVVMMGI